jgi:4-hydroxythreonine-4-phosphate dehydrogenase
MDRPLIGISVGDPAGIGPEITAKAISLPEIYDLCRPLVVAETEMMKEAVRFSGLNLKTHTISQPMLMIPPHLPIHLFP